MSILGGSNDFFGLDIGSTAIRAVQLRGGGGVRVLQAYGTAAVDARITASDARADVAKLGDMIKKLIAEAGIHARNVAVGLPASKVFTVVVDIERLSASDLAKTIRYQADSLIPTPLSESTMDWAVLGDSPAASDKVEVLISSSANSFIEQRLDMLEALGLNVVSFEPESLAMTRALLPQEYTGSALVVDLGHNSTDMVITHVGQPRLVRNVPGGVDAMAKAAAQQLGIDVQQAKQFLFKFGVAQDKLEGQLYKAISSMLEALVAELEKSVTFFQGRYVGQKLERVVVSGAATIIPELPLMLANRLGLAVEIGNAWRNVTFPQSQQNELLALSHQFAVAAGLAERNA